jgi:hypothetical protein
MKLRATRDASFMSIYGWGLTVSVGDVVEVADEHQDRIGIALQYGLVPVTEEPAAEPAEPVEPAEPSKGRKAKAVPVEEIAA